MSIPLDHHELTTRFRDHDVVTIAWKDEDDVGRGPVGPVWYYLEGVQTPVKLEKWYLRTEVIAFCETHNIEYYEG